MDKELASVTITDNTDEVLELLADAVEKALVAIGIQAEANAVEEITKSVYETPESPNYKRTGRLRNSITWAMKGMEGKSVEYQDDEGNMFSDTLGSGGEENTVYVGTNVSYAPVVELGTSKRRPKPFLRPAVDNYKEQYRDILKEALKNG